MQQGQQAPDAFVVTVIKEPPQELTVADLIIGSLGVAGSLLLLALVFGVVAGAVLVIWNRFHPAAARHLPPVSPSFTQAQTPQSR